MKKIIAPQYSEYTDEEWKIWFLPADMIVEITKKELTNLLMKKIWFNNSWEEWYMVIPLDDWITINVKINDIIFNPENLEPTNNTTNSLQDVYLDEWTEYTLDLWDWTLYEWELDGVICLKTGSKYKEIAKLKEWNHLGSLRDFKIKQKNWYDLKTDISNVRLVN
jgi:hypothetical protein